MQRYSYAWASNLLAHLKRARSETRPARPHQVCQRCIQDLGQGVDVDHGRRCCQLREEDPFVHHLLICVVGNKYASRLLRTCSRSCFASSPSQVPRGRSPYHSICNPHVCMHIHQSCDFAIVSSPLSRVAFPVETSPSLQPHVAAECGRSMIEGTCHARSAKMVSTNDHRSGRPQNNNNTYVRAVRQ